MGNYGRTENIGGREMATANALVGTHVGASTASAAAGSPAVFSTAPYKPPKPPAKPVAAKTKEPERKPIEELRFCAIKSCNGYAFGDSEYCNPHKFQLAEPEKKGRCSKEGCKAWAKKPTDRCRHHQED